MTIAALFVDPRGCYSGLPGVDMWPESRDARLYPGPHPVVAHPPCTRWCRLAGLVEARYPHLRRGEDGGCFASALASVRRWGGVLEHPAWSDAWGRFELPIPSRTGGWQRGLCGGWSCYVEQGHYGHRARKATWLYVFGATSLPSLRWGGSGDRDIVGRARHWLSWSGNHCRGDMRTRVNKREASGTPPEFRDVLLSIALSVMMP